MYVYIFLQLFHLNLFFDYGLNKIIWGTIQNGEVKIIFDVIFFF